MPLAPRPARLMHIATRERVTIDPKRWEELYGGVSGREAIADDVRKRVVAAILELDGVHSARRDGQ